MARIQELRQAVTNIVVARTVWDKERLIDKAEASYDGAIENSQFAAATGALKLIGETAGLFDNQPQVQVQITKVTVVLSSRGREHTQETKIVDGTSRVLDEEEE